MNARHALTRAAAAAGAAAAFALSILAPASTVRAEGDFAPLTECVAQERSLAALFLIDTSESLHATDPDGERVKGIQAAISALGTLVRTSDTGAAPVTVYAEFLEFGTKTTRSFPELPEWAGVTDDTSQLEAAALDYANRNQSEDTDYVSALEPWFIRADPNRPAAEIGANEMLERAPAGACRLLVWFTDGQLDIDFQGTAKELHWSADGYIPVTSNRDEEPAELLAHDALCSPEGVVDHTRGSGGLAAGSTFIAAVAFGDEDFDLIKRTALGTGAGGPCGSRPAQGVFLQAQQIDELIYQLRQAVLGPPDGADNDIGTCLEADSGDITTELTCDFPFQVDESLTSFNLLTITGSPQVEASVITPSGQQIPLAGNGQTIVDNGAEMDTKRLTDTVHLVEASLPTGSGDWAGQWRVRYRTSDPAAAASIRNRASIYVFGSLQARLRPAADLLRTHEGSFTVELTAADGQPKSKLAYTAGTQLVVTVNGEPLATPTINDDGSFQYTYTVPADYEPDTVTIAATLSPRVKVADDAPEIPLPAWHGELGNIHVNDVPSYPLIGGDTALETLEHGHLASSFTLHVDASAAPEAGGCIALTGLSIDSLPTGFAGEPKIAVSHAGDVIDEGVECALRLAHGETADLTVTVEVTDEQLRIQQGFVRASMTLHSTSETDTTLSGAFPFSINAEVVPYIVTDTEEGFVLALMLAAVILPLILLYLYNFIWGARLEVVHAMKLSMPVAFERGRLMRINPDTGARTPLRLDVEDLKVAALEDSRKRSLVIDGVEFKAKPSWSPVGDAVGVVDEAGRYAVVSRQGTHRKSRRGKLGLSTMNAWAFRTDRDALAEGREQGRHLPQPADGNNDDIALGEVTGDLLLFLPAPPTRALIQFDMARDEIEQVLPAALEALARDLPEPPAAGTPGSGPGKGGGIGPDDGHPEPGGGGIGEVGGGLPLVVARSGVNGSGPSDLPGEGAATSAPRSLPGDEPDQIQPNGHRRKQAKAARKAKRDDTVPASTSSVDGGLPR